MSPLAQKPQIFDLQVNNDDVVVVKLEEINLAMLDPGHFYGDLAGIFDAHHERIGARTRTVGRIASFAEAFQVNRFFAQRFGALWRRNDVSSATVGRHDAIEKRTGSATSRDSL